MLSYTFKNGTHINGTLDQIMKVAEILGEKVDGIEDVPEGYYHSSSKGLVKIADMHDDHIRNSITKLAYEFYKGLGSKKIPIKEYLENFVRLTDEPKLVELFAELKRRSV